MSFCMCLNFRDIASLFVRIFNEIRPTAIGEPPRKSFGPKPSNNEHSKSKILFYSSFGVAWSFVQKELKKELNKRCKIVLKVALSIGALQISKFR